MIAQRAKQKKKERDIALLRGELSSDGIVDENARHGGVDAHMVVPNTVTAITSGTKRKAPKALDEMESEERRTALVAMKNGLKQTVKGNKRVVTPMRITSTAGEGEEYQTATALYESLKKRVAKASANTDTSKFLQFHAFHAIVAIGTIDNQKRLELVAKDLRKICRVLFDHHNPTKLYNFETMGRIATYTCRCLGNLVIPDAPPPASSKASKKGAQGDLIKQARLARSVEASALTVPRICGGKVKITIVDDGRHPINIPGQRISISIEHPGPSSKAQ
ncbi:hypothetical protein CVT25_010642 [Psilocybe cyanescens]|uniref:Uncharacterized protein n=1 Tax=Psilocybe cyanescens TaxID=93625 RepID=A0A409WJV8_PSICY|nr:hypothetical protein CVT25_010642 [Psilocybe cyanescens]